MRNFIQEIEHIDGQFRSMWHFHAYHCYVELHVPDIAITDLDAQESELDGQGYLEFRSMWHSHAYHYYVELQVPDIAITDLDAQESELEGQGYLEITLTCQLIYNLKGLLPAEPQAGRPWVFNGYLALQLSNLLAADQWIRGIPCCRSRADRRGTNCCRVCPA